MVSRPESRTVLGFGYLCTFFVSILLVQPLIGAAGPASRQMLPTGSQSRAALPALPDRALIDRYCVTCHNERTKQAGLMLDRVDPSKPSVDGAIWEKVVRKIRTGAMPPLGAPRPDKAAADAFVATLETALDDAAAVTPNPGRTGPHRVNRTEYANAIRDLLALEIDPKVLLPPDDVAFGFDNMADILRVSVGLQDRYVAAARKISRLAVGDPALGPGFETYRVNMTPLPVVQEERISEDLPFGTRGGMSFRHHFPLDGEYVLKLGLQRSIADGIRGMGEQNHIDVRVDGTRVTVFTIGGDRRPRGGFQLDPIVENTEAALQIRFPAKAGTHVVGVTFAKATWATEGLFPRRTPDWAAAGVGGTNNSLPMGLQRVELAGPYAATGPGDTPSRRKIFGCRPTSAGDEQSCAKTILATLARQAFRRPVTNEDLQPLMQAYAAGRGQRGFEEGIQAALEYILVDPEFLIRVERPPATVTAPGAAYRISDLELASRLSFFLWSSIPDDELLRVAERNQLRGPELERQVKRMLQDDRSRALITNFAAQWLTLRNLNSVTPGNYEFPEFDDNLRQAFVRELELFLESQLREDHSVTELLTAKYTFVNERLARHYGIPNVYGNRFRRVEVPDERAGLLGKGGILTLTSYATRTSPVLRGRWILDNIIGAPPPPPPPNVPSLQDKTATGKPRSVREAMEQHRKNPVCASCHARMDPLGFALENFNGTGKWRDLTEAGTPVDASSTLADGRRVDGALGLRTMLTAQREAFVHTLTEKMLTYALGRGVEYYDQPAVRAILRAAAPGDYRWSALIVGIVKSMPFQMKRMES